MPERVIHGRRPIYDNEVVDSFWEKSMKENILVDLSKQFAIDIITLCGKTRERKASYVLTNQLLRCGTSIGANVHEANYASSRADFVNKLQIALKECYESDYWLNIFVETKIITDEEYRYIYVKCCKIRTLLTASINTAKSNL